MAELLKVTQILKPFAGYGHIDQAVLDKAADRGTRAHCACNAIVKGISYTEEKDTKNYIESFKKWYLDEKNITFPKRFYDNDLGITGECDGLWKDKEGSIFLFDLKTSVKEGKTWPLQIAAYRYLAEKAGFKIDRQIAIHLFKTGKEAAIYEYEYEKNLDLFFACYKAYKAFFVNDPYYDAEDFY